jgi:succinate dehydrogenase / fumarate reductase iron-sulfur subunit
MHFSIFRYDPARDEKPYMQDFHVALEPSDAMLLDVILRIKNSQDDSLTIRRSCREGVCGSDAININGRNGLACVTRVRELKEPVTLRPLPSFPVIRDLVVDMTRFWKQYDSIKPYLINDEPAPEKERLQSPADREKLDGSYECIMCGCCTSQCPSSWWNPDKFVGPAGLIQAYRFINDSRDRATQERLDDLNTDPYRLFRCRTIMNCTEVCPRGLSPSRAIERIRLRMLDGEGHDGGLALHRVPMIK